MTTTKQGPAWVAERTAGIAATMGPKTGEIRVEHTREPTFLHHSWWFCTPEFVENGTELGHYRLTVQHPPGCTCEVP